MLIKEEKFLVRKELLKKINEDERERVFLESQLSKVEKKELNLINKLQVEEDPYQLYLEKLKIHDN